MSFNLIKNLAKCFPFGRGKNQLGIVYPGYPAEGDIEYLDDYSIAQTQRHWPDEAEVAILMVHGFTATPNTWSDWFAAIKERGYAYSAPTLAGHGLLDFGETYNYNQDDWYSSVLQEYTVLKNKYPDAKIIIAGHSLGGALSIRLIEEVKEKHLFLLAPCVYLKKEDQDKAKWALPILKNVLPGICLPAIGGNIKKQDPEPAGELCYAIYNWLQADSLSKSATIAQETIPNIDGDIELVMVVGTEDAVLDKVKFKTVFDAFKTSKKRIKWCVRSGHVIQKDWDSELALEQLLSLTER